MKAIQIVEDVKNEREAIDMLHALQRLDGFIGGRILKSGPGKPWRAQAFYRDQGDGGPLPEGMRRVEIPAGMHRTLGIR